MSVLVQIPPQPFLGSILIRTALVWAFVRTAALAVASGVGMSIHPIMGIGIVGVVALVMTLDLYRRDEVTFLRALGVGPVGMLIPTMLLCVALEATFLFVV